MNNDATRVYLAIAEAVREAVEIVGVEGVRKMSMFPSANKVKQREPEPA